MSSSSSVQLPYAAAAAPPPHGEEGGQPEGACCDVLCAAPAIAIYPSPNSCSKRQFLPRAHRIETEVALRDPGNCACAGLGALEDSRLVHEQLIQSGFKSDVSVRSSLVGTYAKCGSIEDVWRVFNKMLSQDVVTWTAMILGLVKCGQGQKVLELF